MNSNSDKFDQQILDLVNQERTKVGADSLQINEQLDQAADLHSQDQARMDRMTHNGSNGSSIGDRVNATGYDWSQVAENVSQVALDPETMTLIAFQSLFSVVNSTIFDNFCRRTGWANRH